MNRISRICLLCTLPIIGGSVVAECPDTDGNGFVDATEVLAVVNQWGECEGCSADVDGSGAVDTTDILLVIDGWGECDEDTNPGTGPFNYGEALQKGMTFYYANRSGDLPEDYPLDWRDDCFNYELEQVNGQYPVDQGILNRYMDAGDTPTFVLPISSVTEPAPVSKHKNIGTHNPAIFRIHRKVPFCAK